jgi:hypothetical protein
MLFKSAAYACTHNQHALILATQHCSFSTGCFAQLLAELAACEHTASISGAYNICCLASRSVTHLTYSWPCRAGCAAAGPADRLPSHCQHQKCLHHVPAGITSVTPILSQPCRAGCAAAGPAGCLPTYCQHHGCVQHIPAWHVVIHSCCTPIGSLQGWMRGCWRCGPPTCGAAGRPCSSAGAYNILPDMTSLTPHHVFPSRPCRAGCAAAGAAPISMLRSCHSKLLASRFWLLLSAYCVPAGLDARLLALHSACQHSASITGAYSIFLPGITPIILCLQGWMRGCWRCRLRAPMWCCWIPPQQ